MRDTKFSNGDLLSDEVDVKLYVFCSSMVNRVPGHIHRGDVVAESRCRGGYLHKELAEEMP